MKENLPSGFISHVEKLLGNEAAELIKSYSTTPPVSVRINPFKNYNPPENLEKVPWCDTGFYLPIRPVFTLDPSFHAGAYYVQEASSMFLEQAVNQTTKKEEPAKVLDISAAPGGKSTHLLSLLPEKSLLVANEVIRSRAGILKENIIKWGEPNVIVTSSDPERFSELKNFFDIIVIDAPCSGEGLFRKDANAIKEWSQENVNLCELRQKRILNNVWSALKPGGYLIYSTCTYQTKENEDQLLKFINENNAESVPLEINEGWNIQNTKTTSENKILTGYRFYPHKIKGEGFFLSIIKKESEDSDEKKLKITKEVNEFKQSLPADYITENDSLFYFEHNGSLFTFPVKWKNELNYLTDKINIVYAGIEAGKIAGKDFIPAHALALSSIISNDVPSVELNDDEALQYLRKSELKPQLNTMGWHLVKYKNLNLGWIKVLQNRLNNYYPKEYRIRM